MSDTKFKVILGVIFVFGIACILAGVAIGRHLKVKMREGVREEVERSFKKNRVVVIQERLLLKKVIVPVCPPPPPRSAYQIIVRPKTYHLRKGRTYYIRTVGRTTMGGEYRGARKIKGRTFLVFRQQVVECKGKRGCWGKRNIQLDKIVEITDQHHDQMCKQSWCTD